MIGAIAGDIIGSIYEFNNIKTKNFPLISGSCFFTDDSVLTIALADAILNDRDYGEVMKEYYRMYPDAGYGGSFHGWAQSDSPEPYNSWGNGSAMRTSPIGWAYDSLDEVIEQAEYYASFTHNHPEGIKGARGTAACIFLARNGSSKAEIKNYVISHFGYDLSKSIDEIRPDYRYDVSCMGTVPQAITAFLESTDFEDAIRNAISIGGDSDTLACITGSIAEAYYGEVPHAVAEMMNDSLDDDLLNIVNSFTQRYVRR